MQNLFPMGKLVAAFGVSHAPGQTGFPEIVSQAKMRNILRAWDVLRDILEKAKPDVLIAVSNDHFQNFFRVQPSFCVGVADEHMIPSKSSAKGLRLTSHPVSGRPDFAIDLIRVGLDQGMDLAYSEDLKFIDEISVPKHFLDPNDRLPLVPILTNCLNRNQPTPKRFFELGRVVAKTIAERPVDEKVAVLGTGGLSHDPTGPNWCIVDEEFDRRFLDLLTLGDTKTLMEEYTLDRIFEPGSGGTPEVLNWFVPLGVVGEGRKGFLHCYEAVPEWAAGMGYFSWEV